MIKKELLEALRCPLDPSRTLVPHDDHLACSRCDLHFKIKDGFPVMLVDEAILPAHCPTLSHLPCQKDIKPPPKG